MGTEKSVEFTEAELKYLSTQKMGRVATVGVGGMPHVVPVTFEISSGHIFFGGTGLEQSLKYKHIEKNPKIAFVVDSVRISPWRPIGIEVRGTGRITLANGRRMIELIPLRKASWGIE